MLVALFFSFLFFLFFPLFSCCLCPWLRVPDADAVRAALWDAGGGGEEGLCFYARAGACCWRCESNEGGRGMLVCTEAKARKQSTKQKGFWAINQYNWTQSVIFSRSERSVGLFVGWALLTAHPSFPVLLSSLLLLLTFRSILRDPAILWTPARRILSSRDHDTARTEQGAISHKDHVIVIFCETVQNRNPPTTTRTTTNKCEGKKGDQFIFSLL